MADDLSIRYELEEIKHLLAKQAALLEEIAKALSPLLLRESLRRECSLIKNRRLRVLRQLLVHNEDLCIADLAKAVGVSEKTLRCDLELLAKMGLVRYSKSSPRANPGRSGNRPRLTARGRYVAKYAEDFDELPEHLWARTE